MKGSVNFFNEGIDYKLVEKRKIKTWIKQEIYHEKFIPGCLNYIFTNDEILGEYNIKYLKHNTLTDILTFPLAERSNTVSGDIFISVERIIENARVLNVSEKDELLRVIIHGVLHLVGFKDKFPDEKKRMREREDLAITRFFLLQSNVE